MASEKSRIFLCDELSKKPRKFLNIIGIYKDGKLLEYKLKFVGVPQESGWFFQEDSALDVINGNIYKLGKPFQLRGEISVGYHADGNIFNKAEKNFKPKKQIPLKELGGPKLFLRIFGFYLDGLTSKAPNKPNSSLLELKGFKVKTRIGCDCFISKGKGDLNFDSKGEHYSNSQIFDFYDDIEDISFHLHFFETQYNRSDIAVMIVEK